MPATPKAALVLLMWFYGALPGVSYEQYRERYIAAGGTDTARVERCFAAWKP